MSRVALVLSHDFGELFNALYFLAGTPVTATLLAPPRLAGANPSALPWPLRPYLGPEALAAAMDELDPEVILLFSGYLLTVNQLLAPDQLAQLLARWQGEGRRLITSDPALGILAEFDEASVQRQPAAARLIEHFRWLVQRLADLPHLYLAPPTWPAPDRDAPGTQRREWFFNPRFQPPETAATNGPLSDRTSGDSDRATDRAAEVSGRWLFILSPEDYAVQTRRLGRWRFAEQTRNRLNDALTALGGATLLAPRELQTDLAALGPVDPRLEQFAALPWQGFLARLAAAEAVFYWNQFSASILARVVWEKPFFTFAAGHLGQVLPGVLRRGEEHFYGGRPLPRLDPDRPLERAEIQAQAASQLADLIVPTRQRLAAAPLPETLLARWSAAQR